MTDFAVAYKTLNRQSQIEVEKFVLTLAAKQENVLPKRTFSHSENVDLVKSFMGKTDLWKDSDILEYQRQLRGEYKENV